MGFDPTRRLFIKSIAAVCLLSISRVGFPAATQVIAVRVWPSSAYTRITLESNMPLQYKQFSLSNPDRIVIDIENLQINTALKQLTALVQADDPYLKQIRVAQFKPNVVRIVLELKQSVELNLFVLKPFSNFHYRLVTDLYPAHPRSSGDPLVALLELYNKGDLPKEEERPISSSKRPKNRGPFIVMLDPGHGGEDPGAIGYHGTQEKKIVLQIAKRVRRLLEKEPNLQVHMTREEDVFIPLKVRVAKARKLSADIFISIHADAFPKRSAKGSSVFALSLKGATSSAASYLAKTQNESDLIGGVSRSGDRYLDSTILDLMQTATISDSLRLGSFILSQMKPINRLHKNSVDQAGFAVLKAPDIPSILLETAFISNLEEERKLKTAVFQNQVANAILHAIRAYRKFKKL